MFSPSKLLSLLLAATAVQGAVLNFDDVTVLNEPTYCGSASPSSYHGFAFTGEILNTTTTQSCHGTSAGWGPWGFATSGTNLLSCAGSGSCALTRASCFGVSKVSVGSTNLHWTWADGSQVAVTFTGKRADGSVKVEVRKSFTKGQVMGWPQQVVLEGFSGLRGLEIKVEKVQLVEGDMMVVSDGTAYLDDLTWSKGPKRCGY